MIKIIKFSASWCQPCKVLKPIMDEVKNENPNVIFENIDVDQNKDFAMQSGVTSVPTVIIYKNGNEASRFSGVKTKTTINNIINQYK